MIIEGLYLLYHKRKPGSTQPSHALRSLGKAGGTRGSAKERSRR